MRTTSAAESRLCRALRRLLASLPRQSAIRESEEFRDVLVSLEFFIPEVLREIHQDWEDESLDGVLPAVARKLGNDEIEIVGHCILISDQTLTPFHLRLQLDPTEEAASWLECRLREAASSGMTRAPYKQDISLAKLLGRPDRMEWVYHVGYGERRE